MLGTTCFEVVALLATLKGLKTFQGSVCVGGGGGRRANS